MVGQIGRCCRGVVQRLKIWNRGPLPLAVRGEKAAERFLERQGMIIVGRRDRTLNNEIDLVAVDQLTVVFVEVKARATSEGGHPLEAVDREKQLRISRAAMSYVHRHDLVDCPVRFDVVSVIWPESERRPQIEHVKNAFEYQQRGERAPSP